MLVANLFSQFASDASTVAKMVNYMSALMSGACILFLFWSITHLVRKLVVTDENNITRGQMVTIMGSGLVGALAYTFSDTFWFSAVEGEVYAFSSLFTAVVFWLILKWEDVANEPHSDRWLILIAYLTGLSIGVHLLNLLCLPAIVLVYYYKKVPNANARGSLLALLASGILVAAVLYGIVPGIVKVGGWFELLFVNTLGMSFNTGVIVYIILLAACLIWGIYESYTERNKARMALSFILTIAMLGIPFYGHGTSSVVIGVIVIAALWLYLRPKTQAAVKEKFRVSARTLNTSLLCTMMIVIGYSSYALIVIRSTANTPMDQNSPEDIFTLGEYLGREQYGTRPLFYGPAFSSQVALDVKDGYCEPRIKYNGTKFIRKEKATPDEKDSYIEIPGRIEYEYAQNMLFPRMYSSAHTQQYHAWQDIKGYDVPYDKCGNMIMVNMPTQWENIKFFFSYQLNWMYWRYFMWNFAGKNWVRNKNQDLKVIPTDSIVIKVDKEAVRRSGMMIPGDSIPDYMHISLKGKRALYKSELMMLEMLSEANWERPIYIAVSVGRENQLNMENHFVQEGLAYRFTPFDTSKTSVTIDSEKMYDNLMNKFKFGGIDKPGIYIDENAMRMCHSHRRIFSQLVQQLMREGKKDKAKAALDYAEKMIPAYNVPYDWQNGAVQMAEAYYQLGETAKADEMMKALADKAVEYLTWYLSLDDNRFMISTREFEYHWAVLDAEVKAMKKYNSKLAEIYEPKVEELYNMYVDRMKE